jgi:hypothetical protein
MMGAMKAKPLLPILTLVATLASCADEPAPPPSPVLEPQAVLSEALTNAYEIDTVHEEFRMSFSAGGERFEFSGSVDLDNARQRASMSMDLGMLGGTMDMVVADGVTYMRSPMMAQHVDTEWVSMDLAELNPAAAAQFSESFGGATDASSYAALLAGVVDAHDEGQELIDGVRTTHYVGTVDVVKASEALAEIVGDEVGHEAEEQLERTILQLKVMGLRRVPFEAWVDDDGLLRRERFTMDLGLVPGAEGATMEMTIDFSAYGEPVEIDVPPRSKVTDITDLIRTQDQG